MKDEERKGIQIPAKVLGKITAKVTGILLRCIRIFGNEKKHLESKEDLVHQFLHRANTDLNHP
jgi:hypothetical protein